jgi:DNA modification methylase
MRESCDVQPVNYLETSVLHCEDNLKMLTGFPPECVDLVYLDPPFFSNRIYEVIWGDEAEVRSFADRWEGGIQVYLDWMEARLVQLHRILKPTGSLFLHCDQAAGHYLKVLLDEIFGVKNFRNEIIWRRTASNKTTTRFGPIHQNIFYYGKSKRAPFYTQFGPYTEAYVREKFDHIDARGRYQEVALTGSGTRKGESRKPWRGYNPTKVGRHWALPTYVFEKYEDLTGDDLRQYSLPKRLDKLDEAELIHWPVKAEPVPRYKFYLEDAPGVALQDLWSFTPGTEGCVTGTSAGIDAQVKWLSSKSAERVGYPTQKPEGILERIIKATTKEGEIVLDPFCGCGTTVAAAERLKRRWIGIDVSPQAVEVMKLRLAKQKVTPVVHGLPASVDDLRQLGPFEFQHWIVQRVLGEQSPRKTADKGIDGYSFFERLPIQVKQKERVGRPDLDAFETAIRREKKHKGFLVAFSFSRGAIEGAAVARKERGIEIVLVKVEDVVQVGELIDSADRDGRPPDLSNLSRDLMSLFSALEKEAEERPFYIPPSKRSKPSAKELISSARGERKLDLSPR